MHHLGRVLDGPAGQMARAWWPRHTPSTGTAARERVERDADVARVLGPARGRGDHYVVHIQRGELLPRELVVAHDHRLAAVDLTQQVEEVECVGVVVVDQQRAHPRPTFSRPRHAGERAAVARRGSGFDRRLARRQIERALTARGHACGFAPVTRMVGRIDGRLASADTTSRSTTATSCSCAASREARSSRSSSASTRWTRWALSACARSTARTRSSGRSTSSSPRPFWPAPACPPLARSPASGPPTPWRPSPSSAAM